MIKNLSYILLKQAALFKQIITSANRFTWMNITGTKSLTCMNITGTNSFT